MLQSDQETINSKNLDDNQSLKMHSYGGDKLIEVR